jgi:hypothetical protein
MGPRKEAFDLYPGQAATSLCLATLLVLVLQWPGFCFRWLVLLVYARELFFKATYD